MNVALHQELAKVSLRYRLLLVRTGAAVCFLSVAVAGLAVLAWARGAGYAVPGILLALLVAVPFLAVPFMMSASRAVRNPMWVARRIERRFPDLDARLLAALEQRPRDPSEPLGFLQQTVVNEAVEHARARNWEALVPARTLRIARWAQWAMLVAFAAVLGSLVADMRNRPGPAGWWAGGVVRERDDLAIKVEPEDTEIERGTSLLVLARFEKRLPGDVELLYREPDGDIRRMPMSKSLDDPLFAGRLSSVGRELSYSVRYGDEQTRWYKVGVFDYPDLKQADAKLKFPEYTGLEEKVVEDTRSVSAVEGTQATLRFRLNKPVSGARLVPSVRQPSASQPAAPPIQLSPDPSDPTVYTAAVKMSLSHTVKLYLIDEQGRHNKQPPELVLNVLPNRPPELKLAFPARDVDVSPLEELSVKAQVWDDFGVRRVGMSYGIAGGETSDVVLAEGIKGKEKLDVAKLLPLEQMGAEPDQLLSYYLWVEDMGPDGAVRRTSGDMFFAEVRPFDQIFRQGQQPAGGQQQQQQQQGGNAQQAEELAELQKQIINATWKVVRREISATPTAQFVPDTSLLGESQATAKEKAGELAEKLEDERSKAHLKNVLKHMDAAIDKLNKAETGPSIGALPGALASEQAAYQELLKLRAREHQVVRSNQRQRQQGGNSSAANRRQQQLNQLELDQEDNRYESQSAPNAQQDNPEQRETRQVLNRLRELAQRQEDLNRQMRELQNALEQARDEQKREEIQRQLARLREQQQQMLRDTDELRDRMDQPENQQRMADARQQLEQTRENIRRASEALEQGMVPQANSSGARAEQELNNLREEFRKSAAGQFSEAMDRMRQDARQLDQKQQELSQKMNDLDKAEQRALRDTGDRQELTQNLGDQKQNLDKLLNDMRKTIEESETAEPLLSKQLYDTVRDTHQLQPDQALDATRQLLERGFVNEARQAESEAGKGVTRLREGVEKAAESVLGDETEALRRARNELDALAQELDREIGRRGGRASNATQPTTEPSTREQYARADAPQPGDQQQDGQRQQRDGQQPGSDRQGQQEDGQQPGQQNGQQQSGGQQPGQQPGEQQRGQQPGGQQPGGQQQGGQRPSGQQQGGRQPGEQQPGGQRPGGEQQGGEQQDGQQQPGQPQGGQQGGLRQNRDGQNGQRRGDGTGDLRQFLEGGARADGGRTGPGGNERLSGPLTGDNFRDWSDRLRDVEEMVGDPRLRAEAARIRDRAQSVRSEFNRHSKEPNWDLVRDFINRPLVELRDQVAQELLRRESSEALVPIDREPVPPEYADQVRRYYERLGSGSAGGTGSGPSGGRPGTGVAR